MSDWRTGHHPTDEPGPRQRTIYGPDGELRGAMFTTEDARLVVDSLNGFAAAREESGRLRASLADDIRAAGWLVVGHDDTVGPDGELTTGWLFFKDGRHVRGEGHTDADALAVVRRETGLIDLIVDEEQDGEATDAGH